MAQDTTEALLAAARAAFSSQGFAATSLEALAASAGVTRGALHHHFTNKTGIFEAVLRQIDAEIGREVEACRTASAANPWAAFEQCFHVYLDAILLPDRHRILFQDAPAVLGVKSVEILLESGFGAMAEDLRQMLAQGLIRPVDSEALGHLLNGATINLAFWAADGAPGDARLPRAHATLAAMFEGLGAQAVNRA